MRNKKEDELLNGESDKIIQSLIIYISHMKRKGAERMQDETQTQIFSLSSLHAPSKAKFNFSLEINLKTMKAKPTDIHEAQHPESAINLPRYNPDQNPLTPTFVFDQSEVDLPISIVC